jgi:sugar phosphate isomerase/epimerase
MGRGECDRAMPLAVFPKCFLDDLSKRRTMSVGQWIDLASQLDVDGLEFYWGFTPHDNPLEMRQLRDRIEGLGLTMPMMCYSPDFIKPDPAERSVEVEKEKRAIEVTAMLGGKYCRVLSGQRRADVAIDDGIQMAAECITSLLPHAQQHGVTLILENHYKDSYWDFPEFAQKSEVFLKLLRSIPESPWFGVNYDPSNAIIAGEDPIELLRAVKDRVVTMHASDRYFKGGALDDLRKHEAHPQQGYSAILKHGVIGRGLNDYDTIFSILASVEFQGWISIEDGQDSSVGMEHLRLSAEFLRQKMKEHGLT